MQPLAPSMFAKPVANVTRAFYCSYRREGVRPTQCQQCWISHLEDGMHGTNSGLAYSFHGSHADCIHAHRVIAIQPFERKELDSTELAVWEYLQIQAKGLEHALASSQIRRALAAPERGGFSISDDMLRKCVREIRPKGYLVISCQQGFYVPQTREEVLNFMQTQHSRAAEIKASISDCQKFLQLPPEKLAALGLAADGKLEEQCH